MSVLIVLKGALRGAFTGAILGGVGYANANTVTSFGEAAKQIGTSALVGCAAGAGSGGSCSEGAKLAAMAQTLKVGMDTFSNQNSSLKVAEGEPVVKPSSKLKIKLLAQGKCDICDVVDTNVPNTGMAVTTHNINLVGKPVSYVLKNYPNEIVDNPGLYLGENGVLASVSRNVVGVNPASVFHDTCVGVIERRFGFSNVAFTVGTIPPAFALQYSALGVFSYDYYYNSLREQ